MIGGHRDITFGSLAALVLLIILVLATGPCHTQLDRLAVADTSSE